MKLPRLEEIEKELMYWKPGELCKYNVFALRDISYLLAALKEALSALDKMSYLYVLKDEPGYPAGSRHYYAQEALDKIQKMGEE